MKIPQTAFLALLMLPCSAADKAKKQEQALSQQAVAAHGIDEAIANTQAVPLAPGKKVKRSITSNSPVLELDGHRVAYDLYSMSGSTGKNFKLVVWSICKCFGFDKTIIVPKIVVVSHGNPLPTEISTVGKAAAGLTPLHYETTLTGTFDGDGVAHVLLYGDSGEVGSTVTKTGESASYAAGMIINIGSFDITKSPVGNISIELQAE